MDEFDHIFPLDCLKNCPNLRKDDAGTIYCDKLEAFNYICPLSAEEYNELKFKEE